MNEACVKTYVSSTQLWQGESRIELPPMEEDQVLYLSITVPSYGSVDGMFRVTSCLPSYDPEEGGFYQEITVSPIE